MEHIALHTVRIYMRTRRVTLAYMVLAGSAHTTRPFKNMLVGIFVSALVGTTYALPVSVRLRTSIL